MLKTAYGSLFFNAVPSSQVVSSNQPRTRQLPAQMLRIMRMLSFFIFAACISAHATGVAQNVTISGKDLTLKQVFSAIEKQTGYVVFNKKGILSDLKKVSLSVYNIPLADLLQVILKDQPVDFVMEGKTIIISRKSPAAAAPIALAAPPINVRGRVTTEAGAPASSVSVQVKGTNKGTITDSNGEFHLDNIDEDATLVFTATNIETVELKVNKRTEINITAKTKVSHLDEIQVIAYGTTSRRLNTGNVVSVRADEISKQPVTNPLQALQGRAAGVYIEQTNGFPGSAIKINIRGRQSIQNGTDPLYIVDGVPYHSQTFSNTSYGAGGPYTNGGTSTLNNINPNDIESIEILKDADATAIYGSRGANGVILITTKKGKKGKTKFDINVISGFSKVANELKLLNTQQHLAVRRQGYDNDNSTPPSYAYDVNGVWDTTRHTNWQKELIGGTADFSNAQLTISGGTGNTQYSMSGTYHKEGTVFPGSAKAERGAIHFSVVNESSDQKFKARFNASYSIGQSNIQGIDLTGTAINLAPNAPKLYTDNGELNFENSTFDNPLALLNQKFRANKHSLICNTTLGYEVLPGFTVKANLGVTDVTNEEKVFSPSTIYNPALGITPASSSVFTSNGTSRSWIAEPQITYENARIGNGKLSVVIGGSLQSQQSTATAINYFGFSTNSLITDPRSASENYIANSSAPVYRYGAVFGRLNYNLDKKYIINLTGRRDGSSRFGPGKQFATLGAIGGAWIFSEESFISDNIAAVSFGKLRGSYGITGNDQIGDYNYLDVYQSGASTYQSVTGLSPQQLYNPNYSWETTRKLEIALELGVLNDRIFFTAAYFNNRSSNQLVNYKVATTTGFSSILKNLPAKVENSGVEFEVSTTNIDRKVKWSTSFNLTIPQNKLLAFPNIESSSYANIYTVGKSLNIVKQYHLLGVDPATGLYTFEDMNHDGSITVDDRMQDYDFGQKYYGGMNNTFSYKGLTLDIFFQFVDKVARDVYYSFNNGPGRSESDPDGAQHDVWSKSNPSGSRQRYYATSGAAIRAYSRYTSSDAIIVNAAFIRLKNVSMSYALPGTWFKGISGRLFMQGQNLLTITEYKGLDPENGTSTSLPPLRTIVFGAQITI